MRALSPSAIKGRNNTTEKSTLPRPGSFNRLVYDALYASRGREMTPEEHYQFLELTLRLPGQDRGGKRLASVIRELKDYWGCDIRRLRIQGSPKLGTRIGIFCLVGEWCGRVYIDYTEAATVRAEMTLTETTECPS